MKRLIPLLLPLLFACTATAFAQDPFADVLPEMSNQGSRSAWESQDPRYDTPKQAVHRKAAWKAAQRRHRLATMKQLGYSPSRPPSSSVPFMASPARWVVVPAYYPFAVTIYHGATSSPGLVR